MNENAIGKEVVEAAVQVHRELGRGCFEAVNDVVDGSLRRTFASWRLGVKKDAPIAFWMRFVARFRRATDQRCSPMA